MNEERALMIHRFLHAMEEPSKEVFSLRTFGELSFEAIDGKVSNASDQFTLPDSQYTDAIYTNDVDLGEVKRD